MQDKDNMQDEFYRDKLKEFKLPVSDKVFTAIKKEMQVQNKKKGFGFGTWLLLITLTVGAIAGGYFLVSPTVTSQKIAAVLPVNAATLARKKSTGTNSKEKALVTKTEINKKNTAIAKDTFTDSGKETIAPLTNETKAPLKHCKTIFAIKNNKTSAGKSPGENTSVSKPPKTAA